MASAPAQFLSSPKPAFQAAMDGSKPRFQAMCRTLLYRVLNIRGMLVHHEVVRLSSLKMKRATCRYAIEARMTRVPHRPVAAIALAIFCATVSVAQSATNESNLPVVFLDSTNQIVSERKVSSTLTLQEPKHPEATNRLTGIARIHGGVSQAYAKKSYGITLDAPISLLGMRKSAHWLLNAAYIDRSLMRHKLAYDLFRSLSASNAPRFAVASRFVEVRLNGKYNGVYLLMERVDGQLFGFHPFKSNDTVHACIYKAVDHSANFNQPGHAGYEQRQPDALTYAYWAPLDRFDKFVSTSSDSQFFNPTNGIAGRLDLDNAIDFHLLVLLTRNIDGITKNFIIARDAPSAGPIKPKFFFAPWDYDGTFGRNWDATPVPPSGWLSNHLFDRLMSNGAYREKFAARWRQLRDGPFSANKVQAVIDSNVATLGPAVQRNARRWPTTQGGYPDNIDFAEDVREMKSWIEARIKWLDQEILKSH